MDLDFSNTGLTNDEEDLIALSSNLYGHTVFNEIVPNLLKDKPANQERYMQLRSVAAKRSVALQSLSAIAAMKTKGASDTAQTANYLRAIMKEFNSTLTDADIDKIIGKNPSYYAQMEILTKKQFQTPGFFVDLYEQPANVARRSVVLDSLELMQDNDLNHSNMRSSMMMSVLLELMIDQEQRAVQNRVGAYAGVGQQ